MMPSKDVTEQATLHSLHCCAFCGEQANFGEFCTQKLSGK
jgi:hypothetical protein